MTKSPLSKAEEHALATVERIQRKADLVHSKGATDFADKLERVAEHCKLRAQAEHFLEARRRRNKPSSTTSATSAKRS